MLLLTRKIGDSLIIGDSIKIRVVKVQGCQVRLGIEAPKDVRVFREEILNRKKDAKSISVPTASPDVSTPAHQNTSPDVSTPTQNTSPEVPSQNIAR